MSCSPLLYTGMDSGSHGALHLPNTSCIVSVLHFLHKDPLRSELHLLTFVISAEVAVDLLESPSVGSAAALRPSDLAVTTGEALALGLLPLVYVANPAGCVLVMAGTAGVRDGITVPLSSPNLESKEMCGMGTFGQRWPTCHRGPSRSHHPVTLRCCSLCEHVGRSGHSPHQPVT